MYLNTINKVINTFLVTFRLNIYVFKYNYFVVLSCQTSCLDLAYNVFK